MQNQIESQIIEKQTDGIGRVRYIAILVFISINLVAISGFIAGILFFSTGSDNYKCDIWKESVCYVLYDKNSNKPIGEFGFFPAILYYLLTFGDFNKQISAPFEIQIFIYLPFILGYFVTNFLIKSSVQSPLNIIIVIGRGILGFFGLGGLFVIFKLLFVIGEFADRVGEFVGRVGAYFWLLLIFLWFFGGYTYMTRIWKVMEPMEHENY